MSLTELIKHSIPARITAIILAVGLFAFLAYAGFGLVYYISMQKENKKAMLSACKENAEREFIGQITNINTFDYNSFMNENFFNIEIEINNPGKEKVNYQYNLKTNREILEFAKIGQKVTKIKGQGTFELTDSNGKQRNFIIANCAKTK